MKVHGFTLPQLEFYRTFCNFVGNEKELFEYRAQGKTLDECCELMHMEMSGMKKLSRRVNQKIIYVTNVVKMEKWIAENFS